MEENGLREKILEQIVLELAFQRTADPRLLESAVETIMAAVPKKSLELRYRIFVKSGISDEKDQLEIAILTRDFWVYDLTFSLEERSTIAARLGPSSTINLVKYHNLDTEKAALGDDEPPYRATLSIFGPTDLNLVYTAEGNRKLVERLISFASACIQAAPRGRA